MMPLLVFIALGVYATLGTVLWIVILLQRLSGDGRLGRPAPAPTPHPPPHWMLGVIIGQFAVWEWRESNWRLTSDNLPPGTNPGPPPGYPGAIEGETIKTWIRTPQP